MRILRLTITFFVFFMMMYCMISREELYPFAPYTMYSHRFHPNDEIIYRFFVAKKEQTPIEIDIRNAYMIYPFDEARLQNSLLKNHGSLQSRLDTPELRLKIRELLKLVNQNTKGNFESIYIHSYQYKSLDDLRAKKATLIEQVHEKID